MALKYVVVAITLTLGLLTFVLVARPDFIKLPNYYRNPATKIRTSDYGKPLKSSQKEPETVIQAVTERMASGFNRNKVCGKARQLKQEKTLVNCTLSVDLGSVKQSCESLILCKFMVVSAMSDNHFKEAIDFIASVQTHMPQVPILVYNLGLSVEHLDILHSYCDVEIRDFNFSKYPSHVHRLGTYAWKPLIINLKEMWKSYCGVIQVLDFNGLWFLFSHNYPGFQSFLGRLGVVHLYPWCTMACWAISISRRQGRSIQTSLNANVILFWLNYALKDNFLDLWVDCALHEECIAPNGAVVSPCNWTEMRIGSYACHRFDQAAYNCILIREFGFDFMRQMALTNISSYFVMARRPTKMYTVRTRGNCH